MHWSKNKGEQQHQTNKQTKKKLATHGYSDLGVCVTEDFGLCFILRRVVALHS